MGPRGAARPDTSLDRFASPTHAGGGAAATSTYRLFNCARCSRQVRLCSPCDRGNHYCAEDCAAEARRESVREAGLRYRRSAAGRARGAVRQKRHRLKRQAASLRKPTVTHHGSAPRPENGKGEPSIAPVEDAPTTTEEIGLRVARRATTSRRLRGEPARCDFCGCSVGPFTRLGPLRPPPRRRRRGPRFRWLRPRRRP